MRELAQVEEDRKITLKEAEIIMGKLNYYSAQVQVLVESCGGQEGQVAGQQGGGVGRGDIEVGQVVEVEPYSLVSLGFGHY